MMIIFKIKKKGILSSGSYFGEIGLLWLKKRSVSVRALTNCIFLCLKKSQFDQIMEHYSDIKEHLYRVG
jgi:CRP-like cAMP-binding protein